MTYQLIYADPPWSYGNTISNGAAGNHYSTMTMADLKRLPVWAVSSPDSVLAMWYTGNHSQKPWEVRRRLELLYGDVSRVELFSRGDAPGWDHWGNECPVNSLSLMPAAFRKTFSVVQPESF